MIDIIYHILCRLACRSFFVFLDIFVFSPPFCFIFEFSFISIFKYHYSYRQILFSISEPALNICLKIFNLSRGVFSAFFVKIQALPIAIPSIIWYTENTIPAERNEQQPRKQCAATLIVSELTSQVVFAKDGSPGETIRDCLAQIISA